MKRPIAATIAATVFMLAMTFNFNKTNLDYMVHLPIIAKPPCEVAAYITATLPELIITRVLPNP